MAQQKPNDQYWMKLVLNCATEGASEIGMFNCGRPLTLQDINKPTAESMMHMVASMLLYIDPSFDQILSQSRMKRMPNFEQFGIVNDSSYDAISEIIFKATRKFFPDNDATLRLSLFIMPEYDVKRAKQMLNYLMGYLIASEQCHERFEVEWNSLNAENQEKNKLHGEIEDLKNEIAEKIIKLQADKDAKPQYEKDLVELEEQVVTELSQLSVLEETLKTEKQRYDEKHIITNRLEADLAHLKSEEEQLNTLLVPCPKDLIQQHKFEQQNFKDEQAKRDLLGTELKEAGWKVQFMTQVIEKASASVNMFAHLISILKGAGDSLERLNRKRRDYETKKKDIEEVNRMLSQLDTEQLRIETERDQRVLYYQEELLELQNLYSQTEWNIEEFRFQSDEELTNLEEAEKLINELRSEIEEIEAEIREAEKDSEHESAEYKIKLDLLHEKTINIGAFVLSSFRTRNPHAY